MNFLAMCQRLKREAGLPGGGPVSVSNQTGIHKQIVEWIQSADEDIQNQHADWEFLVRDFEFQTIADQQEYSPVAAGLSDLNRWKVDDVDQISCRVTYNDEQFLIFLSWPEFRRIYQHGASRSIVGRPQFFSVKPDKSIVFYPTPDIEYSIAGEYCRKAQILTNNTDEPLYPSEYHMAAVWRALMLYGAYDAADERYTHGQNEYRRVMGALKADQLPQLSWGEPLA